MPASPFERLQADVRTAIGVEDLSFDSDGVAGVSLDDGGLVEIALAPDGSGATLTANIGQPSGDVGALHRWLLVANSLSRQTDGLVMSLDGVTGDVWQSRRIDASSVPGITRAFDVFLNQRELWVGVLASPAPEEAALQATEALDATSDRILWA